MAQSDPTAGSEAAPEESLEALFLALEGPLLTYAWRWVRDTEAAEDVVQEAFMKLHAQFNEVRDPRAWLYRTVHNLALNHRRRAQRVVPLTEATSDEPPRAPGVAETADSQPWPDETIVRQESLGLVRLSLESLDPRSRELVQLKFQEGLSYKEISRRTGLKVGHVGYLLHHALKAIAAELAKTGVLP